MRGKRGGAAVEGIGAAWLVQQLERSRGGEGQGHCVCDGLVQPFFSGPELFEVNISGKKLDYGSQH